MARTLVLLLLTLTVACGGDATPAPADLDRDRERESDEPAELDDAPDERDEREGADPVDAVDANDTVDGDDADPDINPDGDDALNDAQGDDGDSVVNDSDDEAGNTDDADALDGNDGTDPDDAPDAADADADADDALDEADPADDTGAGDDEDGAADAVRLRIVRAVAGPAVDVYLEGRVTVVALGLEYGEAVEAVTLPRRGALSFVRAGALPSPDDARLPYEVPAESDHGMLVTAPAGDGAELLVAGAPPESPGPVFFFVNAAVGIDTVGIDADETPGVELAAAPGSRVTGAGLVGVARGVDWGVYRDGAAAPERVFASPEPTGDGIVVLAGAAAVAPDDATGLELWGVDPSGPVRRVRASAPVRVVHLDDRVGPAEVRLNGRVAGTLAFRDTGAPVYLPPGPLAGVLTAAGAIPVAGAAIAPGVRYVVVLAPAAGFASLAVPVRDDLAAAPATEARLGLVAALDTPAGEATSIDLARVTGPLRVFAGVPGLVRVPRPGGRGGTGGTFAPGAYELGYTLSGSGSPIRLAAFEARAAERLWIVATAGSPDAAELYTIAPDAGYAVGVLTAAPRRLVRFVNAAPSRAAAGFDVAVKGTALRLAQNVAWGAASVFASLPRTAFEGIVTAPGAAPAPGDVVLPVIVTPGDTALTLIIADGPTGPIVLSPGFSGAPAAGTRLIALAHLVDDGGTASFDVGADGDLSDPFDVPAISPGQVAGEPYAVPLGIAFRFAFGAAPGGTPFRAVYTLAGGTAPELRTAAVVGRFAAGTGAARVRLLTFTERGDPALVDADAP